MARTSSFKAFAVAQARGGDRFLLRHGHRCVVLELMADRLEGREFVAGRRFEGLNETVTVIGQQHRVVAGPGEFDIERRLAGDGALVRIEDGDHLIAGDPLSRMDRGGPGMVDEVKLGIVMAKGQRAAIGLSEDAESSPRSRGPAPPRH